ncbi:MAG: hypothetical protein ACREYE_07065 [Gammaproteobacteria bacterium]
MDNKLSNHEMVELWDAAQHMLKNPLSQCFNATEVERFAEQHWRCGGRILNLLVKVQADWLRLATGSLALNGSQATALQQSVKIGGFWFAQFLQLQRAACAQWRNAANGLNPRSLAGVAVSEDAWRELAAAWQQGAQEILQTQQNLVSTLTRAREKSATSSHDAPTAETPAGRCSAA